MTATVQATATGAVAGGTATVTKPTGTVSGDLLVAVQYLDIDGGTFTNMNAPAGWTELSRSDGVGSTSGGYGKVWYKIAGGSEAASYAFTGTGAATNYVTVHRINGHNASTPFSGVPVWSWKTLLAVGSPPFSLLGPAVNFGASGLLFQSWMYQNISTGATITAPSGMTGTSGLDPFPYLVALTATLGGLGPGTQGGKIAAGNQAGALGSLGLLSVAFGVSDSGSTPDPTAATTAVGVYQFVPRRLPITVRVKTSRSDDDITDQLSALSWRSSIPGGYASASFTLNRPLDVTPDDVEYYATVYIYDGRHGGTLFEGRLEDPGRGVAEQGEVYNITAVGPSAHAKDRTFPVIYVDQSLERWHRSRYSTPSGAKVDIGVDLPNTASSGDEGTPCILISADEGTPISTSWAGDAIYRSIYYAGQTIARIRADYICGGSSSNYQVAIFGRSGDTTADFSHKANWVTSSATLADNLGSGIPTTDSMVSFRAERDVSSTTADAMAWAAFYNVSIRCAVKNADGTDNFSLTGYGVNNIDPVEVVADLLGRVLNRYDGANAVLIGSGVDITQLAYPDGTTASDIFDDIAVFDPGFYWAAWETNPNTGLNRFEYVPWPSTVRYEADTIDGFDSPGSATDLYNAVDVRWRDASGRIRHTVRTQTVDQLTDAGLTRTSYIDISDEMGSLINAQYIGDNFLAEHQYPENAGTLTVARPILDNDSGRMVQPWELLPGGLIRVRGVSPRVDALNPAGRDGITIFRVISVEFNADTASASLELDSYNRTIARQLAGLTTARLRKR
jgi:hypothetical protein